MENESELDETKEMEVDVNILQLEGDWALVEDVQTLRRVSVPAEAVADGKVKMSHLQDGIAYGIAWEDLAIPQVDVETIAFELRRHGLQTVDDVKRNPTQAAKALQSAYMPILKTILKFVKNVGGK